ncbi:Uncharacterized protein dnm_056240 [Desulfonema magnum]|uniref:Uncharacterized protein n=1 Tax=Desulfonema magnum TaxID=45655 RepID=A0A975BQK6_9BACT|nr:Uncharacterized protein dnm_056240 [Desulfonema magnum]
MTEANTKESLFGEIPEGLPASTGRGMYEERHTGTWETLRVPDDKE